MMSVLYAHPAETHIIAGQLDVNHVGGVTAESVSRGAACGQ